VPHNPKSPRQSLRSRSHALPNANNSQLVMAYSPIAIERTSSPQPITTANETANSTIQEMTKLYLDNYKRQLQDSKSELNSRMSLLDREKEKVSRIRDLRKRELYMRRQAAIEAFRLERERELNMQICKIDELKSEINNEPDLNLSFGSSIFNTDAYRPQQQQQQQTRDRLAHLRRHNFSTAATQSDFFAETTSNNPYYTSSMLHFDDTLSHSFVNTPRSARIETGNCPCLNRLLKLY